MRLDLQIIAFLYYAHFTQHAYFFLELELWLVSQKQDMSPLLEANFAMKFVFNIYEA